MIVTIHLIIITWATSLLYVKIQQQFSIADVGFGNTSGGGSQVVLNASAVPSAYIGINHSEFTAVSHNVC